MAGLNITLFCRQTKAKQKGKRLLHTYIIENYVTITENFNYATNVLKSYFAKKICAKIYVKSLMETKYKQNMKPRRQWTLKELLETIEMRKNCARCVKLAQDKSMLLLKNHAEKFWNFIRNILLFALIMELMS